MIHIVNTLKAEEFYPFFYETMNYNDWAICYNECGIVFRQDEPDAHFDVPRYASVNNNQYTTVFIIKSYEEAINRIENIDPDFIIYNKNVKLSMEQIEY